MISMTIRAAKPHGIRQSSRSEYQKMRPRRYPPAHTFMQDLYDVVVVEDGTISCVTYWTKLKIQRAVRLAEREGKQFKATVGICLTGTLRMGNKATHSLMEMEIDDGITIDGRAITRKKKLSTIVVTEKK